MNSRRLSTAAAYPFTPALSAAERAVVKGIADLRLVVQQLSGGGSSSAGSSGLVGRRYGALIDKHTAGTLTTLTFAVSDGTLYGTCVFTVPNKTSAAGTGLDKIAPSAGIWGTLLFRSSDIDTADWSGHIELEPCRIQWQTESITGITIGGVRHAATPGGTLRIRLHDGYNTALSVKGNQLQVLAGAGLGKGRTPAPASSGALPLLSINGLVPVGGDIPLAVTPKLALVPGAGSVTLTLVRP